VPNSSFSTNFAQSDPTPYAGDLARHPRATCSHSCLRNPPPSAPGAARTACAARSPTMMNGAARSSPRLCRRFECRCSGIPLWAHSTACRPLHGGGPCLFESRLARTRALEQSSRSPGPGARYASGASLPRARSAAGQGRLSRPRPADHIPILTGYGRTPAPFRAEIAGALPPSGRHHVSVHRG